MTILRRGRVVRRVLFAGLALLAGGALVSFSAAGGMQLSLGCPTLGGGGGGAGVAHEEGGGAHEEGGGGVGELQADPAAQETAVEEGQAPLVLSGPLGPGPVEPDLFHPDNQPGADGARPPAPAPRRGGRVVVHLLARPATWNRMIDNNAVVGFVHAEVHETLLERDMETWAFRSTLAREWIVEDRVRIRDEEGTLTALVGVVEEHEEHLVVVTRAPGNPVATTQIVPRALVDSLDRAVVHTFLLRDDVTWHDGHPFDAHDVYFSWRMYSNPTVDCEHDREEVNSLVEAVVLDDHTVRFEGGEQYFAYPQTFTNLCLLPAHLYDLSDPDNEHYDEDVDSLGERQGRYVNEHPNNRAFVGLGPYRIVSVADDHVEAVRYDGYFDADPAGGRAGWLDAIRWRLLPDFTAARTALLQGDLDYCEQLSSSDYFGAFVHQPAFQEKLYAAYSYRPQMQYIAWNMRRPQLADARVRRALGHACDWQAFLDGQANGLGLRVTGTAYHAHPSCDDTLEPLAFDPALAEEILDEAGWYDRDDDGVRDKDGRPLRIEFLADAGGGVSNLYARILQEGLARIGVQVDIVPLDSATLYERLRAKEFDAVSRAWFLDPENDPVQVWGRWTGDPKEDRSTNYPGWGDEASDAALASIRRTVDDEQRWAQMRALQRRIFAEQPYLFLFDFPVKFAVSKRIRGFKSYGLQPGYSLRDWYLVEE